MIDLIGWKRTTNDPQGDPKIIVLLSSCRARNEIEDCNEIGIIPITENFVFLFFFSSLFYTFLSLSARKQGVTNV